MEQVDFLFSESAFVAGLKKVQDVEETWVDSKRVGEQEQVEIKD